MLLAAGGEDVADVDPLLGHAIEERLATVDEHDRQPVHHAVDSSPADLGDPTDAVPVKSSPINAC